MKRIEENQLFWRLTRSTICRTTSISWVVPALGALHRAVATTRSHNSNTSGAEESQLIENKEEILPRKMSANIDNPRYSALEIPNGQGNPSTPRGPSKPPGDRCEWCGRSIVAGNRNGVKKRYCGRHCKGAFETAAVRITRLLIEAGQLSTADLKATLQTAAGARRAQLSAGEPEW